MIVVVIMLIWYKPDSVITSSNVTRCWHHNHETIITLRWRHNERDGVSNHQPPDCLLNSLFRHRWKKTSNLRVAGLCEGNSPVTGESHAQRASNAENASIWWRLHDLLWTHKRNPISRCTHNRSPSSPLMGKLCGLYFDHHGENLMCCNGNVRYLTGLHFIHCVTGTKSHTLNRRVN